MEGKLTSIEGLFFHAETDLVSSSTVLEAIRKRSRNQDAGQQIYQQLLGGHQHDCCQARSLLDFRFPVPSPSP